MAIHHSYISHLLSTLYLVTRKNHPYYTQSKAVQSRRQPRDTLILFSPLFIMSNQDEPVDGPTGEYRKELAEEVEENTKKKTIRKSKEDASEDTSNESVTDYGVGEAS
jgi:hypothetical protein